MNGRLAQTKGAVERQDATGDEVVRAQVQDESESHEVVIEVEGRKANADCTCETADAGQFCQHIWSVLVDLEAGSGENGEDNALRQLMRVRPKPPRARKRAGGRSSSPSHGPSEPAWMGRLSLLRPPSTEHDPTAGDAFADHRQVVYAVSPRGSVAQGALVVRVYQRQPTRTGWSKLKPMRVGPSSAAWLPDPEDREICALLVGSTAVHDDEISDWGGREDGHRGGFRLASGAWRTLLQRMCQTGRCMVGDAADRLEPLRWDQTPDDAAWELWAQGVDTGKELSITVELRRNAERLAIADPLLLLGGPDGVILADDWAAAFDDRDATRWVTYFRDEWRKKGRVEPIRVPYSEVNSFLDRLYLLPSLPEIELPDGLGRNEQRMTPVPHLELFSPEGRKKDNPEATLTARVWFAYGDRRVRLGQQGRFVTGEAAAMPAEVQGEAIADSEQLDGDGDAAESTAEQPDVTPPTEGQTDGGETASAPMPRANLTARPEALEAEDEAAESPEASDAADDSQTDNDNDSDTDSEEATRVVASLGDAAGEPDQNDAASEALAMATAAANSSTDVSDAEDKQGQAMPMPPAADDGAELIRRDARREREAAAELLSLGFRPNAADNGQTLLLQIKLMPKACADLAAKGWVIRADQQTLRAPGTPSLSITTGTDWFELRGKITYMTAEGEQTVGLPEILAAARAGKAMIQLGDGSQAILPHNWLESHGLLTAVANVQDDHLRFRSSQAVLLETLLSQDEQVEVDARFAIIRDRLAAFERIIPAEPVDSFQGHLRPYQQHGLGWMKFLRELLMGGILADDMGLGKTVQVLAMLEGRRTEALQRTANGQIKPDDAQLDSSLGQPSLIVSPRSVLFNWMDEARKFTPNLRIGLYSGSDRKTMLKELDQYDVVVTSFGLMRRDISELRQQAFDYVVLDEAQAIKNPKSQSAKAARLVQAGYRLALTGTPVENHLGDLWSIFEFLNPGMLGLNTRFSDLLKGGNARDPRSADAAAQTGRALRPFILRRTKQQVLSDLPDKTEQTIVCEMTPSQRKIYEQLLQHYRGSLLAQVRSKGMAGNTMMVLEALLRLRQAACHPALIDPERMDDDSAKLTELTDRLEEMIEEGHKALVFSQFTSMLAIVRKRLEKMGIPYEYLDGQTRDRRDRVERFQTDTKCPVFLISLKAGGLGLNLTAADYVFILDPWWNPAVEAQAIDRAHRIGQSRHVFAYRMICEDTVEQRIAELQDRKKQLADAIMGGQGDVLRQLTREDLEHLLG